MQACAAVPTRRPHARPGAGRCRPPSDAVAVWPRTRVPVHRDRGCNRQWEPAASAADRSGRAGSRQPAETAPGVPPLRSLAEDCRTAPARQRPAGTQQPTSRTGRLSQPDRALRRPQPPDIVRSGARTQHMRRRGVTADTVTPPAARVPNSPPSPRAAASPLPRTVGCCPDKPRRAAWYWAGPHRLPVSPCCRQLSPRQGAAAARQPNRAPRSRDRRHGNLATVPRLRSRAGGSCGPRAPARPQPPGNTTRRGAPAGLDRRATVPVPAHREQTV